MPWRRFWVLYAAALVGVGVGVMRMPATSPMTGVMETINMNNGRQVGIALSYFAGEVEAEVGESRYPKALHELVPKYFSEADFKKAGRYRRSPDGAEFDWLYLRPPEGRKPTPDRIILAGPQAEGRKSPFARKRCVITIAADAQFLPEAEFQQLLARQQAAAK